MKMIIRKKVRLVLFYFCLINLILYFGCTKDNNENYSEKAPFLYGLERASQNLNFPQESRQRATAAIELWENGSLDSEPFVIVTYLFNAVGEPDIVRLSVMIYDEDKDFLGVQILEKRNADKEFVLREEYPVFYHDVIPYPVEMCSFEVELRKNNFTKNEKAWNNYLNAHLEEEHYKQLNNPSIYISMPEPNVLDVFVSAYDKAGNYSEPVKVINKIE